jgi:hypothetical protein
MRKQLLFRLVLVVGLTAAMPHMARSWPTYIEYPLCDEECCRGYTTDTPEPVDPSELCSYGPQVKSCGWFYQNVGC